jgi:hypothetical protein
MQPYADRFTGMARSWRWLWAGVRPDDGATLSRKVVQVNAGAAIGIGTILIYNLAFFAIGNDALIRSSVAQWPYMVMAPLIWWLNGRRQFVVARWSWPTWAPPSGPGRGRV